MTRLAIVGSRHYTDYEKVVEKVKPHLTGVTEIVSGGATGVDSLAERLAKEFGLELKVFPADWKKYGKKAGPLRNTQIVEYADKVIAFVATDSIGTLDTIRKAGDKAVVHHV